MFLSYSTLLPQKYTDEDPSCGVLPSRQHLWYATIPRALPPVTHGSALQAPECMWGPIRGRTETSRGWVGLSMFIALRWMQEPSRGDGVAD